MAQATSGTESWRTQTVSKVIKEGKAHACMHKRDEETKMYSFLSGIFFLSVHKSWKTNVSQRSA